jgi:hypothetical protein
VLLALDPWGDVFKMFASLPLGLLLHDLWLGLSLFSAAACVVRIETIIMTPVVSQEWAGQVY